MTFLPLYRCSALSSLALSLLVLAAPVARADDTITPAKIDLSRINDQPMYPEGAKDRKEQGNTVLSIYIDAKGRSSKTTVETTSGFADLDKTAVASVWNLHFVPASQDGKDIASTIKVTVHFQLAPLPKPAVTERDVYALADLADKIFCKRVTPATGTHIEPAPACHTNREWEVIADQAKRKESGMPRNIIQVPNH